MDNPSDIIFLPADAAGAASGAGEREGSELDVAACADPQALRQRGNQLFK